MLVVQSSPILNESVVISDIPSASQASSMTCFLPRHFVFVENNSTNIELSLQRLNRLLLTTPVVLDSVDSF